uniref:nuclear pore complex protein NUP98A-like n=1 Tax=Erigeron canadensis TaxID=72917 RepID=UPI001CB8F69A|nr:nuclear pore complex protein NUP98A-like [Erigeron canadensis]
MATGSTFNSGGFNSTPPNLFSFTSPWANSSNSTTPVQQSLFGVPTTSNSTTPVKPNPFGPTNLNSTTPVKPNPFGPFGPTNSNSTMPAQPNPFGPTNLNSTTPVKPNPFSLPTPSVATEPTTFRFPSQAQTSPWNYPGPTSTSFPSQLNTFSSSANTFLTNATPASSNSFSSFAPKTNFTSPASTGSSFSLASSTPNPFPSFNSLSTQSFASPASSTMSPGQTTATPWNAFWSTPVDKPLNSLVNTTATSQATSQPPLFNIPNTNPFTSQAINSSSAGSFPSFKAWTSAQANTPAWPSISSGPSVSTTTGAANSFSLSNPLSNRNPVTNPFTSQTINSSSSGSFPSFTTWTPAQTSTPSSSNAFLTTPISTPSFSMTTAAANSVSVQPVIPGPSSDSYQTKALFNPDISSTQSLNGEKTGITSMEQPSPAASPFGILPPKPQLYFEDSRPIQIGISSMTVKDKPAAVRYQALTTRHLSRNKLPIRKYDPKLHTPKIPFFNDTNEIPVAVLVPRENPRKMVISPVSSSPKASTLKNIGEEKKSSDSLYENEKEDSKASDDPTTEQELFAAILEVPTKLQLPDYYTKPQISDLEAKERAEPGFCTRVKDFVVGRHGYGSIKFLGDTNVRKLDIENLIQFNNREVIVYMDETKKPAVGEGLNKAAEVTLLNIKYVDKKTGTQYKDGPKIDKYVEMLKKKAAAQGAEFMSYDPVEGEWKFRVQHF